LETTTPLITIREARERVLECARLLGTELVEVADALGRTLAEDLRAAADVPAFPCSAMDGYAIVSGSPRRTLRLIGESRAGAPSPGRVTVATAIRISTGAAVPPDADAVLRQEDASERDGHVEVHTSTVAGDNVRPPGDDMRAGDIVLASGTCLGPAELGAAVTAGKAALLVSMRPRVAVLCTGDELRAPGEPLRRGQIHNSNAPMLQAAASRCGAILAAPPRRLPDDRAETVSGLAGALASADVVVVSGGVSVGPHDHVKPALRALGVSENFWGVSLQPGKPTWFGTRDRRLVFGLPGNPVSAAVTFSLFVAPALAALQGRPSRMDDDRQAILATAVQRHRDREQAIRVVLEYRDCTAFAHPNGPQGSHMVSSLIGADALALVPAGNGRLEAGTRVSLAELTH
jgi:molybdopterin molybdotransferase